MIKKPPRTFASKCPSCGIFCQSHVSFRKQFCVWFFFLSKYELFFPSKYEWRQLSSSAGTAECFFDNENGFAALSDFGENNRLLRAVSYDGMSSLCDHFKNLFYSHSLVVFFQLSACLYFSNCVHARTPASISSSISFRRFSKTKFPQCKRMVELVRAKYLAPP